MSLLTFRATDLIDKNDVHPTLVLAFVIHSEKTFKEHDAFFRWLTEEKVPEVNESTNSMVVTDEEEAINKALQKNAPKLPRSRCRNHVWSDFKRKLSENGITTRIDQRLYKEELEELFSQNSKAEYNDMLHLKIQRWPDAIKKYHYQNLHPKINLIGSWTSRK